MDYSVYNSPYSFRYGSPEMRKIWSEFSRHALWREIWFKSARVQQKFGLVDSGQLFELEQNVLNLNMELSFQKEQEIHHELLAEKFVYASQCPEGQKIIHLGLTTMDVLDNAEIIQIKQSLCLLAERIKDLLLALVGRVESLSNTPCIAFTHMQPGEPTIFGYRLAIYAQDLFEDYKNILSFSKEIKGKGFKGNSGSAGNMLDLLTLDDFLLFEREMEKELGFKFFSITAQSYPRKQDLHLFDLLSGLGMTLAKMALDLRTLHFQPVGEIAEPATTWEANISQIFSLQRNPVLLENINSVVRLLPSLQQVNWQNAAFSVLERNFDEYINRKSIFPEAFLICDEALLLAYRVISGLEIDVQAIYQDYVLYSPFAGQERVYKALLLAGADPKKAQERLQELNMKAWKTIKSKKYNPLRTLILEDSFCGQYLATNILDQKMNGNNVVDYASMAANILAKSIRSFFDKSL